MHSFIEYVVLNPLITDKQIDAAVVLAVQLQLGAICVPPYWVKKASREIKHTQVQLTTAIGFPLGYQRTEAKIAETELAFADGAQAVELVLNLSAFKSGCLHWVKAEIMRLAHIAHEKEAFLTVTIEASNLNEGELQMFCKTGAAAGADYIKTATGFIKSESTMDQITKMRNWLPSSVGIKLWTESDNVNWVEALISAGVERVCVPDVRFLSRQILTST